MYPGDVCTARPGRPAKRSWERSQEGAVGCELEAETRGIDVTRRAESIGEGIRVGDTSIQKHTSTGAFHSVPGARLRLHGAPQASYW